MSFNPVSVHMNRITVFGKDLYRDGDKVVTQRAGRKVINLGGVCYDAAAVAFYKAYKFWPMKLLKFLDGDAGNLAIRNLMMCDCRNDQDRMLKQNTEYLSVMYEILETMAASGQNLSDLSQFQVLEMGKATRVRRFYASKSEHPTDEFQGRTWHRNGNMWYSLLPPRGIWDDMLCRMQELQATGNKLYVRGALGTDAVNEWPHQRTT